MIAHTKRLLRRPLAEAAKIVREAGKYGFEHSVAAFARYMGHSTTNSGAFRQRLAAFRDWKLIAGRGDTIVFTDTAKTIALPPDPRAERNALQTAFMNCAVDRFTSSFVDSVVAAGLAEADNGNVVLLDAGALGDLLDDLSDEALEAEPPKPETSRSRVHLTPAQPVVHQEWTLPAGAVVFELRLDRPLPAAAFAQVGAVVQEIEALADRLRDLVVADADS